MIFASTKRDYRTMVYTERKNLTVIELTEDRDSLSFDELIPVLADRPSNMIYIERNSLLYGLISPGRILKTSHAGSRDARINKNFMRVYPEEYMRVREIFRQRRFESKFINALPVVSREGKLLGAYTVYDDSIVAEYTKPLLKDPVGSGTVRAALVKPAACFQKKQKLFQEWKTLLERMGVVLLPIDCREILDYINQVDWILFLDEGEAEGGKALRHMLQRGSADSFTSCRNFVKTCQNNIVAEAELLKKRGVRFLAYNVKENQSGYYAAFMERIRAKYRDYYTDPSQDQGSVPFAVKYSTDRLRKEGFFQDAYREEYDQQVFPLPFSVYMQSGIYKLCDADEPLLHIHHNERMTVGQPEHYERSVYLFGLCFAYGPFVEDKHTIASFLQEFLNQEGIPCRVVNYGFPLINLEHAKQYLVEQLLQLPLKQGDIVIYDDAVGLGIQDIGYINLTDIYEDYQLPMNWFTDSPRHTDHKVNQIVAEVFFQSILPVLRESTGNEIIQKTSSNFVELTYLKRYFSEFDPSAHGTIGSIVMNCNPFTRGHRYLIEKALETVDFLILFVVEEDKSLFTFEERFAMVCAGVSDLANVMVVPSGAFILSQQTFPQYFMKIVDEELVNSTEYDIRIFAEQIAPKLNISYRFVGEEPEDQVTSAYNEAMKRILPSNGVKVVEIPRKRIGEQCVSESRARKCLEENDLERLRDLIPDSTREILFFREE